MLCVYFFFSSRRRHTRYIGDWSSDVCSSDLGFGILQLPTSNSLAVYRDVIERVNELKVRFPPGLKLEPAFDTTTVVAERSEERRVGKECRGRRSEDD